MDKVIFVVNYFHSSGKSPIESFIHALDKKEQAKIRRLNIMLRTYGAAAGMPYVKKICPGIWELRVRGRREIRLLFHQSGNAIFHLHAFIKKTNSIPSYELYVAKKRLKKYII